MKGNRSRRTDAFLRAGTAEVSNIPLRVATSSQSGVSALWRHERMKRRSSFSGFSALGGMVVDRWMDRRRVGLGELSFGYARLKGVEKRCR